MEPSGEHLERRAAARLHRPCPVRLRGRDESGPFEFASVTENVSSGGLYLRSSRQLDAGTQVFGVVTLPTGAAIAAHGRVVRLSARGDSLWGIAVQFDKAELIRSRDAGA